VIGDLNIGSMYGLLPRDFISCDGAEKPQNEGQKCLWECWNDLKRSATGFSIDCVVENGGRELLQFRGDPFLQNS